MAYCTARYAYTHAFTDMYACTYMHACTHARTHHMHAHTHMLPQTDYMHFTIPQSYRCPRVLWTYTWLWSPHFLAFELDAFGGAEGLRKKGVGQEGRDEDRDRRGRSRREGGNGEEGVGRLKREGSGEGRREWGDGKGSGEGRRERRE